MITLKSLFLFINFIFMVLYYLYNIFICYIIAIMYPLILKNYCILVFMLYYICITFCIHASKLI